MSLSRVTFAMIEAPAMLAEARVTAHDGLRRESEIWRTVYAIDQYVIGWHLELMRRPSEQVDVAPWSPRSLIVAAASTQIAHAVASAMTRS